MRKAVLIALHLVFSCAAVVSTNEETQKNDYFKYRLPDQVDVVDYTIRIKPNFKNFTFNGSVAIQMWPKEKITNVTLHAHGLDIKQNDVVVNIISSGQNIHIDSVVKEEKYDLLIINLATPFVPEYSYRVSIEYTGVIRDDSYGFYRSFYKENGETRWFAATQLESIHARKVFPCFDEPRYKASFIITFVRPSNFSPSLSNMPIETTEILEEETVEKFYPTRKMSTYLVAFVVSQFKVANKTEDGNDNQFRIWSRPEANKQGSMMFEEGQKLLRCLENYTGIEYYNKAKHMKIDHVALPEKAGAMENWGLITYGEEYIMFNEEESSAYDKQKCITSMAHEMTHMWFGNLVTCDWWGDAWLHEAFASFLENKISDEIADMDLKTQFPLVFVQKALQRDTSITSKPTSNEKVSTPTDIEDQFGISSYSRGASILRMMEHLIGPETFRLGLNKYLTKMKQQNAKPSQLYESLDQQAMLDDSLSQYDNVTVASVMSSWTTQSGHPILQVNVDYSNGKIDLTQSRTYQYGEKPQSDVLFQIPLTYASKSKSDFKNTKPITIMKSKNITLKINTTSPEWIVFNKQQIGFFRVNYDKDSWEVLAGALKGTSRKDIHTLNRAQIVDDVFSLAKENFTSYETAFKVVQFLKVETDYAPWTAAIKHFEELRNKFNSFTDISLDLDKHLLFIMEHAINTLGLTGGKEDSHLVNIFRANLLNFICTLGHKKCQENALKKLDDFNSKNTRIDPNLREYIYCNGLRKGNASHFEKLWNKFLSENLRSEKLIILNSLGCTSDEESVEKFLEQIIIEDSPIRKGELNKAVNSILDGNKYNAGIFFNFFKNNTAVFVKRFGVNLKMTIKSLISHMEGNQLDQVKRFIEGTEDLPADVSSAGLSALADKGAEREWAMVHKSFIVDWIASNATNGALSCVSFLLSLSLAIIVMLL